jgi:ABC-type glutathione transport system ATPase component
MRTSEATQLALQPALVQVEDLSKRYVQRTPLTPKRFVVDALKGVNLEVQPQCVTAIVGESGSGKSTLAVALSRAAAAGAGLGRRTRSGRWPFQCWRAAEKTL